MTMSGIIALLALAAAPAAPTELALASTSAAPIDAAAAPAAAAPAAAPAPEKICRTRFVVGQGLLNSVKTRKTCRTRAEWKAAGVDMD